MNREHVEQPAPARDREHEQYVAEIRVKRPTQDPQVLALRQKYGLPDNASVRETLAKARQLLTDHQSPHEVIELILGRPVEETEASLLASHIARETNVEAVIERLARLAVKDKLALFTEKRVARSKRLRLLAEKREAKWAQLRQKE